MSTGNFITQENFGLFATTIFDGFYYENEETGEEEWYEGDYWLYKQAEKDIEEFNKTLRFYRLDMQDGYYSGVQLILNNTRAVDGGYEPITDNFTAEEWKQSRKEEKDYYGRYEYFTEPYWKQKIIERKELEKVKQFIRTKLKDEYEFDEYGITARFSNGETWYAKIA